MLSWGGWCEAHFRAPEVANLAALFFEHVEDRLIPVLSNRHLVLRAHALREFRRVAEIIRVIGIARRRDQRHVLPAAFVRPCGETRDWRFRHDMKRDTLLKMPRGAVDAVQQMRAAGTR